MKEENLSMLIFYIFSLLLICGISIKGIIQSKSKDFIESYYLLFLIGLTPGNMICTCAILFYFLFKLFYLPLKLLYKIKKL